MIDAQRPDLSQTEVAATFGLPILAAAQSHRISGGLIRYLLETDAIGTCAAIPPIVAEAQRAVDRIAERLSLATILGKLVGQLAHGQRQWVEIGMVIVCEPKIVLLDEPTAGMSDDETSVTARLIREINKDMTIVVVEHDMQFIGQIASMVTVFHQGKILMEDTFDKVIVDPTVRAVYLGRSQGKVRC